MITVDSSQIRRLHADMGKIPGRVVPEVAKVVVKGALNIKTALVADAGALAGGHAKHFPHSISYDMTGPLSAEVGPDKDRTQGALGNLLYFGSSKNGAVLSFDGPLDAEEPKFLAALAVAAADAVRKAL